MALLDSLRLTEHAYPHSVRFFVGTIAVVRRVVMSSVIIARFVSYRSLF